MATGKITLEVVSDPLISKILSICEKDKAFAAKLEKLL